MAVRTVHSTKPVHYQREVDGTEEVAGGIRLTNIIARLIWWAAGIIIILLAFRFVLALLGANPNNAFANFIYNTSHPFVAPFFGLFSYNVVKDGVGHFELFTLIAMAVYAVLAAIVARLFTLNRSY